MGDKGTITTYSFVILIGGIIMFQHNFRIVVHMGDSDDYIDSMQRCREYTLNGEECGDLQHVSIGTTFDGDDILSAVFIAHSPAIVAVNGKTYLRAFFKTQEIYDMVLYNFPFIVPDEEFNVIDFDLEMWEFTIYNSNLQMVATNETA